MTDLQVAGGMVPENTGMRESVMGADGIGQGQPHRSGPRENIPAMPASMEEAGIAPALLCDLITKHALSLTEFTLAEMSTRVKLPMSLIDAAVDLLRKEKIFEVKGGTGFSADRYTFRITELGRKHGAQLMEVCRYVGPAPVSLESYLRTVRGQSVESIPVDDHVIRDALGHLVLAPQFLQDIGPAITSGRAIFLYGATGNGKTSVAEAIAGIPPDSVLIPYAITVGGEIIVTYDPVNHLAVKGSREQARIDQRWVRIRRPVVMAGGELTLRMLDLNFNPIAKYYEASLQMKANNGIFVIDDFGRQKIEPRQLLNRWIVPLDRKIDYLTLHTGMKFQIPFDMLVVFATNMNPMELADQAFLRRIHYKFKLSCPTAEEFEEIFRKACRSKDLPFDRDVFEYLIQTYYRNTGRDLCASHPRDIVDHIVIRARYRRETPVMTNETVDVACSRHFIQ